MRTHEVDLGGLPLTQMVDQVVAALERDAPLSQKAGWTVMAAWLLHLGSRRLLPLTTPTQQAEARASTLQDGTTERRSVLALADWLDARPQLGRDLFARCQSERLGMSGAAGPGIDIIEFLWAAMALFDDDLPQTETIARYRPHWLDLYSIPEARSRILRRIAKAPAGQTLDRLLPERPGNAAAPSVTPPKWRSAWTSTFVATLELAKQGTVSLHQATPFSPILVTPSRT